MDIIQKLIDENPLIFFKVPGCSDCAKLKNFFKEVNVTEYMVFDLSHLDDDIYENAVSYLQSLSGTRKCPMLFMKGKYYGDYKKLMSLYDVGELSTIMKKELNITIRECDF
jgi:glutaredoxin